MYRLLSEKRGVGGWVDLDKSVTVRITVAAAVLKLFSVFFYTEARGSTPRSVVPFAMFLAKILILF